MLFYIQRFGPAIMRLSSAMLRNRMMHSFLGLLLLAMVMPSESNAQRAILDSLFKLWYDVNQPDTIRMRALGAACRKGYLKSNPDSALFYALELQAYAEGSASTKYHAEALNIQGEVFFVKADYERAQELYKASIQLLEQSGEVIESAKVISNVGNVFYAQGAFARAEIEYLRAFKLLEGMEDKKGLGDVLSNLGNLRGAQGRFADALDYAMRSLKVRQEIDDKIGIGITLHNVGVIHRELKDYDGAVEYLTRSLAVREEVGDQRGIAAALHALGTVYKRKGDALQERMCYQRSLLIFRAIGDMRGEAGSIRNIGGVLQREGRYSVALDNYRQAVQIQKRIGDKAGLASSLQNVGKLFLDIKRYPEAIRNATEALGIAQNVGEKLIARNSASTLYEAYKLSGQPRKAIDAFGLYVQIRDSIVNKEGLKEVLRHELEFEFEMTEARDSLLRVSETQQRQSDNTMAGLVASKRRAISTATVLAGIALIVLSGFVLVTSRKRSRMRQARIAAHLQTRVWRAQVNPQFIHTALQSINEYVQSNERDLASTFLTRFARLMRAVLENARKDEVNLASDLAVIRDYLELERIRLKGAFDFSIEVDEAIDTEEVMVPPMLLQPYAEQVIWGRLAHQQGLGHIVIRVQQKQGGLTLSLQDDGVAPKQEQTTDLGEDAEGTSITEARLELLSKQNGQQASVKVLGLSSGQRVVIVLPIAA